MKTYKLKINGKDYEVAINSVEGKNASVTVNGAEYHVELENALTGAAAVAASQAPAAVQAPVAAAPVVAAAAPAAAPAPKPAASGAAKKVTSPLPGVILDICVKEGQAVKAGDKVAVIEAMKMENDITAEVDGTVASILVTKGESVLEGADILTIA